MKKVIFIISVAICLSGISKPEQSQDRPEYKPDSEPNYYEAYKTRAEWRALKDSITAEKNRTSWQ